MNTTRKLLSDFAHQTADLLTGRPVGESGGSDAAPFVPGYLVRRLIGRGGFATVYQVRSIEGEELALKVLASDPADAARRAGEEAAAAVRHLNVVAVREHGVCDGRPYLVTEYCRGGRLADRLAPPHDDPRWAAGVLRQVADGLAAIHRAGHVHGDLSLNNVLFDAAGVPKIADFGLARPITAATRQTVGTAVAGTPGTAAPERFDGIDTDHRSDFYSLGALGYAMLTGSLPFGPVRPGPYPPPLPLRQLRPHLSRGLAAIVHRCLDPDPAYRYQTAVVLAADLGNYLDGGRVMRTRLVLAWRRCTRHVRRYWLQYTLLGLVITLGLGWVVERDRAARREAAHALHERRTNELRAATARSVLDIADVSRLQASLPGGRRVIDQVRGHLNTLASEVERDPNLTGEAADLYRQCGRLAFKLGEVAQAASDYDAARRLAEAAFVAKDAPANRLRLAMVLREWGVTRAVQWKAAEAKPAWERAFQLLEPLAATDGEAQLTLAQLHMVRANVAATEAAKREQFGAAEQLIEALLRDKPGDRKYRFTLAEVLNNRAHLTGGQPDARERDCRRAVDIRRELVAEQPDDPDQQAYLAASLNHLGNALQVQGPSRAEEARAAYREARAIYQPLVAAFPGVRSNRDELRDVDANLQRLGGADR